jgi:hypothetical protein
LDWSLTVLKPTSRRAQANPSALGVRDAVMRRW